MEASGPGRRSERREELVEIEVVGDELLDDGDLVQVLRLRLDGHRVDLRCDRVGVLDRRDDGDVGLREQVEKLRVREDVVRQDDARDRTRPGGAGRRRLRPG